eukprot:1487255-Amphidinium_carterae.2
MPTVRGHCILLWHGAIWRRLLGRWQTAFDRKRDMEWSSAWDLASLAELLSLALSHAKTSTLSILNLSPHQSSGL